MVLHREDQQGRVPEVITEVRMSYRSEEVEGVKAAGCCIKGLVRQRNQEVCMCGTGRTRKQNKQKQT